MVVGVCKISLMIGGAESLKDKRAALRHLKDRVQNKFNCAIAEVGDQDLLQSAEIGFAVVSNELGFTQAMVHKILVFIDHLAVAKVTNDEQDYVNYGDESLEAGKGHWEPEQDGPTAAMTPPQRAKPPEAKLDEALPSWLPPGFLDGPDPDKDPKDNDE